jgi:TrmH family RNA methyltransferase
MTASNLVLILYQPQEIVNVAAVIRGMSNFGLTTLRLVTPAAWDPYRIAGIAHHTERIIESVEQYESLAAAMRDVSFALATTGRPRSSEHLVFDPRSAAPLLVKRAQAGERVAVLFGTEKDGLPNEAVQRCHGILTIPTPGFNRSLNLAQSAILIMYELGLALAGGAPVADASKTAAIPLPEAPLATGAERESLFASFEGLLQALYPHSQPDRMAASIARFRTLLMRATPTRDEAEALANLLRHAARAAGRPAGNP